MNSSSKSYPNQQLLTQQLQSQFYGCQTGSKQHNKNKQVLQYPQQLQSSSYNSDNVNKTQNQANSKDNENKKYSEQQYPFCDYSAQRMHTTSSKLNTNDQKHFTSTMTTSTISGSRRKCISSQQIQQIYSKLKIEQNLESLIEQMEYQGQAQHPKKQIYSYQQQQKQMIKYRQRDSQSFSECSFSEIGQKSFNSRLQKILVENIDDIKKKDRKKRKTKKKVPNKSQKHNHCVVQVKFENAHAKTGYNQYRIGMRDLNKQWFRLLNSIHQVTKNVK